MKNYIYLLLIILSFISCEKDADIVIKEMPPQLVVSSMLSNNINESYVKLSMTKGFERNTYEYTPITDAQVKATDNQGNIISFLPNSDGIYKTNTPAIVGNTYTLDVAKSTHHLTAESTMQSEVILQDFEISNSQVGRRPASLVLQFQDPSPETDYFKIKVYFEDVATPGNEYLIANFVANDFAYNSQTHKLKVGRLRMRTSGTFRVHLVHIDKDVYKYFETLKNLGEMGYGDSPFVSAVPGNPNTNIQGGIGYFVTGTTSIKEKFISVSN